MKRLVSTLVPALAACTAPTASAQPMQQSAPGGPLAVRENLPEFTLDEVSGLHLARLTVNPPEPRPGCRAQVRVEVENRGLRRWPAGAEFRVIVVRLGDAAPREFRLPLFPQGAPPIRLGVDDLLVSSLPSRVVAELQWRRRQANSLSPQDFWRRFDVASIDVRPSLQGPRC